MEVMAISTCCFTGHRKIEPNKKENIDQVLYETLEELAKQGTVYFKAGGALGFDTIAAKCVLRLKRHMPKIKLHLVLPHKQQSAGWSAANKAVYEEILAKADEKEYISENYAVGCMQQRNRRLIENSDMCICYYVDKQGGTGYTVRYAEKKGLRIMNVADMLGTDIF